MSPQDTREKVAEDRQVFGFAGPYVREPEGHIGRLIQARISSEAFVIDRSRTLRYRGPVDDQWGIDFSKPEPRNRYLEDALDAVLDGRPVWRPSVQASGCVLAATGPDGTWSARPISYISSRNRSTSLSRGRWTTDTSTSRRITTGTCGSLLRRRGRAATDESMVGLLLAERLFEQGGRILGFLPHMHLRGKAFRYELLRTDGTEEVFLDVPRYDFNWQLYYDAWEPVRIEPGDRIRATAWYDNSEANPANPDPSVAVRWGDQSWEEMMIGFFEWVREPSSAPEAAASANGPSR